MRTVDYDKPVKDYITELSATGHVTHEKHKKTSVTLHHNAGNLSHEGLLSVWRVRAASAHFGVDSKGAVAQYVNVLEYAWAVGNKVGNQSSISIEMANSTFKPDWEVSETTWRSAARLTGWLFFWVVKERPSKDNLFYHKHWSATDCAGPYMDKIYDKVLEAAQAAYDSFEDVVSSPPVPNKHKSVAVIASEVINGRWGNGEDRTRRLREAGYNPNTIQTEVNRQLGAVSRHSSRKSVKQIATEVIAGKWGNGTDRVTRLGKAGYDAKSVQREVNRQLR